MSIIINPNNMTSANEVKQYGRFQEVKAHVDKAAEEMKKLDNTDTVDLSPAKGNVAVVENSQVTGGRAKATGAMTYDVKTGEVKKLDLETKDSDSAMCMSDTVTCHLSYVDQGDKSIYDFKKKDNKHDHLSGLTDNSSFRWKFSIDKNSGVITFDDLPYYS